ncbi:hypothetical protein POREN0001_0764 [Porphyromonas endodontalis ATCC 35406]|uniref:Uncharacterized protein n=1 Tax=Porphyromonas endodontalis (strain ATCC 35406 / DSM 24491 / JCM 8526 / CCUG 16442 / BCRC 14492 / NCTC 13058 / HG 370) TaxID=553175 RepID=C3J9L3_POREA|nr:hypothetical protein POREN0001_0764 [Porphyromonas endodontalis ATCC 35406]
MTPLSSKRFFLLHLYVLTLREGKIREGEATPHKEKKPRNPNRS